jgi:hypothetical protein
MIERKKPWRIQSNIFFVLFQFVIIFPTPAPQTKVKTHDRIRNKKKRRLFAHG